MTNNRGVVMQYTHTKHPAIEYKLEVRACAASSYRQPPHEGPVRSRIVFVFPRPKKYQWANKPTPRIPLWQTYRGDLPNLVHAVWDAIQGVIFVNDKQVYSSSEEKYYAAGEELPHVEVTLSLEVP